MVGTDGNMNEEALQLVVSSMRKPIRMEGAQQDFSRANRSQRRQSESLQSARSTDGLRRFIEAHNHSAVDVGGLRRGTISISMKKPQFSETFPEEPSEKELTKWARSGRSLTQSTLSLRGGDRRWLTQTGTLSAKQTAKGASGKSCIIITES